MITPPEIIRLAALRLGAMHPMSPMTPAYSDMWIAMFGAIQESFPDKTPIEYIELLEKYMTPIYGVKYEEYLNAKQ